MTLLDPSSAMLSKAEERLARLPDEVRQRVTFVQADGHNADEAVHGRRFAAVLCHGVLGYLEQPESVTGTAYGCSSTGSIWAVPQ